MHNRSIVPLLSIALLAIAGTGPANAQQMPDMAQQMARMSGTLHAIARACGDATDAELATARSQQKANHSRKGMDPAAFDRSFDAAEAEATTRWKTLTPAQQRHTCSEIKQQWEAAAQALGAGQR